MKSTVFFLIPTLFLVGCFSYKELPVEYDYSYKGRFTKYKTFDLFDQPIIDGDSSMEKDIIEKTIVSRLKFQGYRQKSEKPNLLISYKIFYDSLKFNGYDQPDIEDWVKRPSSDEGYNSKKLEMRTGTVLIQFYDRKQQRSIWQGYATSTFGDIRFEDERKLRNAVISILDKYRFLAEGFLEKKAILEGSISSE